MGSYHKQKLLEEEYGKLVILSNDGNGIVGNGTSR